MAARRRIRINKQIGELKIWEKSMRIDRTSKILFFKNIACEDLPEHFFSDFVEVIKEVFRLGQEDSRDKFRQALNNLFEGKF